MKKTKEAKEAIDPKLWNLSSAICLSRTLQQNQNKMHCKELAKYLKAIIDNGLEAAPWQ